MAKCTKNIRVFSDEIYEDIIFDGKKHISIATIPGMEKITIITTGFSKGMAWTGGEINLFYYISKKSKLLLIFLSFIFFKKSSS